jgi:hypothetical protein
MLRCLLLGLLLVVSSKMSAQLDVDGKSPINSVKNELEISGANTILVSGSTLAPFGLKYQYCRSFGGYGCFKSDFGALENRYQVTLGVAKSVGRFFNIYFGGGIQMGDFDYHWDNMTREGTSPIIEGGVVLKIKRYSIEGGVGVVLETEYYYESDFSYNQPWVFGSIGVGYSF